MSIHLRYRGDFICAFISVQQFAKFLRFRYSSSVRVRRRNSLWSIASLTGGLRGPWLYDVTTHNYHRAYTLWLSS